MVFESHDHWAVGHVDGFSILVFRDGQITEAFRAYHKLAQRMAEYPILDESEYSQREFDAAYENIGDAAWRLKDEFDLPDDWQSEDFSWLSDHRCHASENRDDQGGFPKKDNLEAPLLHSVISEPKVWHRPELFYGEWHSNCCSTSNSTKDV